MQLTLQAGVRLQTRAIGVAARNLRTRRLYRPAYLAQRVVAVAAAEHEVAEADAAAATTEAAAPAEGQRQRRTGGGNNRRPRGPNRTVDFKDLEIGKTYEGVVVSVMEFGAFVNIGCTTDGLLHISQISSGFTRNVADAVKMGDKLNVRVISKDEGRGKFAVTLIPEGEEAPVRDIAAADDSAAASGDVKPLKQARAQKQKREKRSGPPVKAGDVITGKVATVAAFGAFVEVGGGFTGLLHASEMKLPEGVTDFTSVVQEGAELEVRVVSVQREKVALTQRSKEEIAQELEASTKTSAAVAEIPEGASPMAQVLARAGISPGMFSSRPQAAPAVEEQKEEIEAAEPAAAAAAPAVEEKAPAPAAEEKKEAPKAAAAAGGISAALVKELRESSGAGMMDCKKALAECGGDIEKAKEYLRKKGLASADKKAGRVAAEGAVSSYIHAGSRLGVLVEVNCETDFVARGEKFRELVSDIAMQIAACPEVSVVAVEDVPAEVLEKEKAIEMQKEDLQSKPEQIREKIVAGRVEKIAKTMALLEQPFIKDTNKTVAEIVKEAVASIGENIQIRRFERFNLGEGIEKAAADLAADVEAQTKAMQEAAAKKAAEEQQQQQEAAPAAKAEAKPAVAVSAAVVKELREKTGAGMMDCKKALAECGGDVAAASEFLRKKGLASADKKAGRVAAEGAVGAYIHAGSRLGVLVEVNCETDFVARGEKFRELVNDIAMQIAACPEVQYVATSDVPAAMLEREKAIEMQKEDLQSKPEQIREKIVAGRVEKIAKEMALLEQPFIKDTSKTVAAHIKEQVATIGENIQVRRFAKFVLGEGIEKKSVSFAEEVAQQTGAKL